MKQFSNHLIDSLKAMASPESPIKITDDQLYQIIQDQFPREHEIKMSYMQGDNTVHLEDFDVEPIFILVPHTRSAGCGYESSYMTEATCTVTDFTVDVHGAKMFDNDGFEINLTTYQKEVLVACLSVACHCDEEIEERD